jgi:hypothetical protein
MITKSEKTTLEKNTRKEALIPNAMLTKQNV